MPDRLIADAGGRVFQISDPNDWGSAPGASQPVPSSLALIGFVGLALLVALADTALASGTARAWFLSLTSPPGAPPVRVLATLWAVLQLFCGVAGWLAWRRAGAGAALRLWGWLLAISAARTAALFGARNFALAIAMGVLLLAVAAAVVYRFWSVHRGAAGLMVPSLLWTGYAVYLDIGFLVLNPG